MKSIVDFGYLIEMSEGSTSFLQHTLKLFCGQTQKLMKVYAEASANAWDPKAMEVMAHSLKSGFGLVEVEGALPLIESMEKNARIHKDESLARVQWESFQGIWERAYEEIQDFQSRLVRAGSTDRSSTSSFE